MSVFTIAIHGGAGTILKKDMSAEREQEYLESMGDALDAGYAVLEKGGTATNAVKAACIVLEDNILFNAGRGSVFSKSGEHEMDAAIMDGGLMNAGSVAGVRNVRNPIALATEVMLNSNHVFLSGKGATDFALMQGIKLEPDEYFFSQFRYDQWKEIRDSDIYALEQTDPHMENLIKDKKFGTVGAVACDENGNVAAATSTGGMTNKKYGRIGDSPIIGAGNYANNKTCAVSCTGHGELFMLAVAAYDVSCLMEYKGYSIQQAIDHVVNEKLVQMKGQGGMIGVDAMGNPAMVFNTPGMYRGYKTSEGRNEISIYQ
ncbi:MAG: isoaspartyl peptidase/L-asparaginase [Flavisolibacter sp.]|nr:isoaspartyl peptidase/L-asparaginase [Flavisolibacter sp.]